MTLRGHSSHFGCHRGSRHKTSAFNDHLDGAYVLVWLRWGLVEHGYAAFFDEFVFHFSL